ncbi:GntR family transcriptional regulator [Chelatococcus asaccharovorans]|uniref:GntR family transcriptional regulator n=1 Tax=Chelatococcus asaccharovorans TaxID=28210 RepID=A0A2V3TY60_9HYPH|nr:GntR family transcriptional regulator [Chelatococcus asaccharovorans]PXW54001.1 GntR family transcriptional regulator [Chelatococcus asaccharovorans]CAH1654514.1 GntR family transcriptional regulator [Chelatococcus asaccharovorans]CAH1690785.1 GntR family transcriptional regulator [Chelatococcus asaccharovorans]
MLETFIQGPFVIRYQEIAYDLRGSLEAAGDLTRAIASESELCQRYSASRTTIRAALKQLENEGLIERRQGKGTFYKPPHIAKNLGSIVDFHTEARLAGRTPTTHVVAMDTRMATPADTVLFGLPMARAGVVELTRLRKLDGQPAVLQRSLLGRSVVKGITAGMLENASLYGLLAEHNGIRVATIEETLVPCQVEAQDAHHLDIPVGSAVFRSHRVARDHEGTVIEVSDNLIRGDIYRFTIRRQVDTAMQDTMRGAI